MDKNYNSWHREAYQTDINKTINQDKKYYDFVLGLINFENSKKPKKLLDVPCGKGTLLKYIKSKYFNLEFFGADISDFAVKKAKSEIDGTFVVANAEKLPYKNDFFDYITCLGGLEYYSDPVKGVSEMNRVLKKNGMVYIHVPNLMFLGHIYMCFKDGRMPSEGGGSNNKYYDYNVEKFYTYQGWKDIIEKGSLKIVKVSSFNNILANSGKISLVENYLYKIIKNIVPFYFSYNFVFVCKKN